WLNTSASSAVHPPLSRDGLRSPAPPRSHRTTERSPPQQVEGASFVVLDVAWQLSLQGREIRQEIGEFRRRQRALVRRHRRGGADLPFTQIRFDEGHEA